MTNEGQGGDNPVSTINDYTTNGMITGILGALCMFAVALLLRALYLIFCPNGYIPKSTSSRRCPIKALIILGSGGHTTEMLHIVADMRSDCYSPRIYVRASEDVISEAKVKDFEGEASDYQLLAIHRSRKVHQPYLASVWTTIIAISDSVPVILNAQPDLILCNGPGPLAVDAAQLAKLLLPSKSLLNDIQTNSPLEIRRHLTPIFNKLWASLYIDNTLTHKWMRNAALRLEACLDRTWESLNSGCWKDVSISYRYCYSLCTILKAVLLLKQFESAEAKELRKLKEIILLMDKGILLGAPPLSVPGLLSTMARELNSAIVEMSGNKCSTTTDLMTLSGDVIPKGSLPGFAAVVRCYRPSMEAFHKNIFQPKIPSILEGCMDHWRALNLWRSPDYLLKIAGIRTVPIEIGSRYTEEDWTQRLITFSEFFESYVTSNGSPKLGYLAQHELFDQIPELMDDISIPDYCSFSDTGDEATAPSINAWLGPGGTISPLHFDSKNNLLCQVFGIKQVVLFHPKQAHNLYPYESRLLFNTARVDPMNPDLEAWPKFRRATGETCTLGPGEMLFIPPGWWHHVVALRPSFSVSFWWN